ncbi:hypothetical protein ACIF85_23335 [Streptomyces sp. NPDC086033]|uniref:hypothetical protein n=1 Tax=Streptomyces sp. NPDC086033 TaxID=3365747 RepID=UPI00225565FD
MAHVTDDDIAAFPSGGFPGFGMTEPWAPLAGIEDTEDACPVELELPGVDKDQTRSRRWNAPGRSVGKPIHIGPFDCRTTLPPNSDTGRAQRIEVTG